MKVEIVEGWGSLVVGIIADWVGDGRRRVGYGRGAGVDGAVGAWASGAHGVFCSIIHKIDGGDGGLVNYLCSQSQSTRQVTVTRHQGRAREFENRRSFVCR